VSTEKIAVENNIVLSVEKNITDGKADVDILLENDRKCVLHWGLRKRRRSSWETPPPSSWPEGSRVFDSSAIQTPFTNRDGKNRISLSLELTDDLLSIDFVLFYPDEDRWDNNGGRNYRIRLIEREASSGDAKLASLAEEIVEKEMSKNSWTLMHRFNLCYDLLDEIDSGDLEGLALIFVWLRYSFIRQLDWQRNYNTKPREMGHAMDRLTHKLADRYAREGKERPLIRLIMTTLGHGSDAQRVRDEVLNIMHRHHIKEVSGHFMEEWHQKLHNNATADDIVICEALLAFLKSDGDLDLFYRRLEEGGVTKNRMEAYERPIKSHPDFIPHLKDALIRDFEHFLGILKEVHAGTDLGTATHNARHLMDNEMHGIMDYIWEHHNNVDRESDALADKVTFSRRLISDRMHEGGDGMRDLLFLDIALEDFFRGVIEKNLGLNPGRDRLIRMTGFAMENLFLSEEREDLSFCLGHWRKLAGITDRDREWAMQAKSVLDRFRHLLSNLIDCYFVLIQPRAEYLGREFQADSWTINLFAEEVLRGRPAFALSMLIRDLDGIMRKEADLGDWQIISPGAKTAVVETAETLRSLQGEKFEHPVAVLAGKVAGDEEIPEGIVAIITPDTLDILSHLAVRARNAGVLFAICYDSEIIGSFKSLKGKRVRIATNASGDVVFEESEEKHVEAVIHKDHRQGRIRKHGFSSFSVSINDFNEETVGGKSYQLRRLSKGLPEWIGLPSSAALPFGVFERTLEWKENSTIADRYAKLSGKLSDKEGSDYGKTLAELKDAILELSPPEGLVSSLRDTMGKSGLPWPEDWEEAWTCIKRVWASKWNERAYLSRIAMSVPHEDLLMAVLIQRVVDADYSFVIHTVNPFTGKKDEIYAEVALGLGEALVGNYPGKSLSFACGKHADGPMLLSFPAKNNGLFGGGMIFRSDSNGEDLAGFAGAGLYDSFIMPQPSKKVLDYTEEPLIWDADFRREAMTKIARIGIQVEDILGSPQDIEGAFSRGRYFVVQSRPQVGVKNE
jgi:alpha-glucan,water dikinase